MKNTKKERVNKVFNDASAELVKEADEDKGYFWGSFGETSDRGFCIIVSSVLDNLLKSLIEAAYIKDDKVKQIFKEEKIFWTALTKIKIAYFSGYIPKYIYHDLVIVNRIRNMFAHEIETSMSFENESIKNMVDSCVLAYEPISGIPTRFKFTLVATQIYSIVGVLEKALQKVRPWHLMEILGLNETDFTKWRLTGEEVKRLMIEENKKRDGDSENK